MADTNRITLQEAVTDLKAGVFQATSAKQTSATIPTFSWENLAALGIPPFATWLVKSGTEMYWIYNYAGQAFLGYGVKLDFPDAAMAPILNGKYISSVLNLDFRCAVKSELAGLLSTVAHDGTMSGDGTEISPLGVVAAAFMYDDDREWPAGTPAFYEGAWYCANPEDPPLVGESPGLFPEKWVRVGGDEAVIEELREQLELLRARADLLWLELFGTSGFFNGSAITFITLEGIVLERGVWNEPHIRLEC
jgi:hypothetical protein